MDQEIWFDNGDGLKFVEYVGEGADKAVKEVGMHFQNALSSDVARKMYAQEGSIIVLLDDDNVVANTYFSTKLEAFTLFLEMQNKAVDDERYLNAFYNMLNSKGLSDQFVKACVYTVNKPERKEFVEGLAEKFSTPKSQESRPKP